MKKTTEALEYASVKQYCKAVRMPSIAANFVSLAEQAVKENQSHIRYLETLLAMECEERDRHAIENRIRDAQLPRIKTLEEFNFTQSPRIIVTPNLPFSEWTTIFPNPRLCKALLDRITDRAHIIETGSE